MSVCIECGVYLPWEDYGAWGIDYCEECAGLEAWAADEDEPQ